MSVDKTPEDLGIEDPEAFAEEQREKLSQALDEEVDLSEEERDARDALLGVDEADTIHIKLGKDEATDPPTVEVRTEIPGWMEQRLERIDEAARVDEVIDDVLALLCGPRDSERMGIIVAPEKFTSRKAWLDVYSERGSLYLMDRLEEVFEPASERMESVKNSRGAGGARHSSRSANSSE